MANHELLSAVYNTMERYNNPWLQGVQATLTKCELSELYQTIENLNRNYVKTKITNRLRDIYTQKIRNRICRWTVSVCQR